MARPVSRWWLWGLMLVMLVTGTLNSVLAKLQYKLTADGMPFRHPYILTLLMFVGESLCFLAYLADKRYAGQTPDEVSTAPSQSSTPTLIQRLGVAVFALPAALDVITTTLVMIGLNLTGVSVYQMLKGSIVVIVAFYSVVFLKKRLYQHHMLGVVLIFVGVGIVGVGSIWLAHSHATNPALGAALILLGQLMGGAIFVLEEQFFSEISVPPLKAVGVEGLSGLVYCAVLLPILYFIPCYNTEICSGDGHVEDTPYAFKQMAVSAPLLITSIAGVFSVSFFNWSGLSVTKNASSLARSTIDTARTVSVWIAELALGWEGFSLVQLCGFLLLALGTFIYNEVLVIPWLGFKEAVQKHQQEMANKTVLTAEDDIDDPEESKLLP